MSTPYHPHANGKVEVTNRELENILTKVIQLHRKGWSLKLQKSTLAFNTTWKSTTGFTPYELVYGKNILLPIKFEVKNLRIAVELNRDLSKEKKKHAPIG